ncbi:MAG: NAD(P)H-dependent oxidoreductase [Actinomycetales bacterium]|nr:NAD(P)H-dependent oxidoreductase [Actinomycetales bacterium]
MRMMIVIGSVRPGRVGPLVADWVTEAVRADPRFEPDLVDLAELDLPFMDEPAHPRLRQYTHEHTRAWSARVDAADAVVFVTPEYNHSFAPALKNAIDYLHEEWWRKPVGFVSYGGISAGTRGVTELESVVVGLGMVKTGANVEIPFVASRLSDGRFAGDDKLEPIRGRMLDELAALAEALRPLQNR